MKRGDVFMAIVKFTEGVGSKRRPVVIVQANRFNSSLPDTLVAGVTSQMALIGPPNRFLFDPTTSDGAQSGLDYSSVVRCDRLSTIARSTVGKRLGQLSPAHLAQLDACLRSSLDLP